MRREASPVAPLWLLLLANVSLLTVVCWGYVPGGVLAAPRSASWIVAVWLTYPWLFLLPAFALCVLVGSGVGALRRPRLAAVASLTVASVLFAAVQLTVLADQRVLALYGFHLNGFVWNLLTTRGGIAALGAGPETYRALAVLAAAVLLLEAAAAFGVARLARGRGLLAALCGRHFVAPLALGLLGLTAYERLAFGACRVDGYRPVLEQQEAFPFYQRTSYNSLAKRLGVQVARSDVPSAALHGKGLHYPLQPLTFRADAPRYNVIVLCAESLRADALSPERMPATSAWARRGVRFENHLSAGNGTRMGVFGLLYGLPGPYWFRFLNVNRGPALLGALQERGWDVRGFTADDFSYPEFDQTVFAEVDRRQLREFGGHTPSWQRDRAMVDGIVSYLDARAPERPFFVYAFFESPHARYEFPPETAVVRPYLETFDYVSMNLARDISLIWNRYLNSVRHLDTQYERVLAALEARGLLDSTIVVITGDHGEEFLEHGRWGHNSAFSEPQIRVPFVLLAPGVEAGVRSSLTSHLDVPATLLELLGSENAPSDYSVGRSLLSGSERRYTLVSDWQTVTYVDGEGKVEFPMHAASFGKRAVADRHDESVADSPRFLQVRAALFAEALGEMGHLTARR